MPFSKYWQISIAIPFVKLFTHNFISGLICSDLFACVGYLDCCPKCEFYVDGPIENI